MSPFSRYEQMKCAFLVRWLLRPNIVECHGSLLALSSKEDVGVGVDEDTTSSVDNR
jgi:hypothetical protein